MNNKDKQILNNLQKNIEDIHEYTCYNCKHLTVKYTVIVCRKKIGLILKTHSEYMAEARYNLYHWRYYCKKFQYRFFSMLGLEELFGFILLLIITLYGLIKSIEEGVI